MKVTSSIINLTFKSKQHHVIGIQSFKLGGFLKFTINFHL